MTFTDAELLAGLAFLRRYAHPDFMPSLQLAESAILAIRRERALDEIRARPIADLELSIRAHNTLARFKDLTFVRDLEKFMDRPDSAILRRTHHDFFGMKTIKEIRALLKEIGLESRRAAEP